MATIGRNHPCPCGSGIKYKKCCLPRSAPKTPAPSTPSAAAFSNGWVLSEDDLDNLSNAVGPLVQARRFDEALALCQRLRTEYPDVVDGLERTALVYSAQGDHATAASFYRQAFAFVTHPSRRDDYENSDFYLQQAEKEELLTSAR